MNLLFVIIIFIITLLVNIIFLIVPTLLKHKIHISLRGYSTGFQTILSCISSTFINLLILASGFVLRLLFISNAPIVEDLCVYSDFNPFLIWFFMHVFFPNTLNLSSHQINSHVAEFIFSFILLDRAFHFIYLNIINCKSSLIL